MKSANKVAGKSAKKLAPATTPEGREDQLIALAFDTAERQLLEGTASSQVISQLLRLGTTRMKLEKEKLRHENELLKAKTEAIRSGKETEEMYKNAIEAMRIYGGHGNDEFTD